MPMKNAHDLLDEEEIIPCATRTTTVTGAAVDMQQYVGKVKMVLMSSIGTGTTPTLDVKLQDSADGSTGWADIAGATFTQVTDAADAIEAIGVTIDSAARYIRGVGTIAGTTPSFSFGLCAIGMKQVPTT